MNQVKFRQTIFIRKITWDIHVFTLFVTIVVGRTNCTFVPSNKTIIMHAVFANCPQLSSAAVE